MQKSFLTDAPTDARTNADKDFEKRAMQAQKKDCERILKTRRAAAEIEFSMFGDCPTPDANGQVELF